VGMATANKPPELKTLIERRTIRESSKNAKGKVREEISY